MVKKIVDNGLHVTFCNGVEGVIFEDNCIKPIQEYSKKDIIDA